MLAAKVYQRKDGSRPFDVSFSRLEARAAARIGVVVTRLEQGLRPHIEPVGEGVLEAKIDYGPGYRVYFALDGKELIVLLLCGNKSTQASDIKAAKVYWKEYRERKKFPLSGSALFKPSEKEK